MSGWPVDGRQHAGADRWQPGLVRAAARSEPSVRPVLKPSLRRLWRDRTTLQLGVDARTAVVLAGVDATTARLLGLLDGTRTEAQLVVEATAAGGARDRLDALLAILAAGGALDDAAADV